MGRLTGRREGTGSIIALDQHRAANRRAAGRNLRGLDPIPSGLRPTARLRTDRCLGRLLNCTPNYREVVRAWFPEFDGQKRPDGWLCGGVLMRGTYAGEDATHCKTLQISWTCDRRYASFLAPAIGWPSGARLFAGPLQWLSSEAKRRSRHAFAKRLWPPRSDFIQTGAAALSSGYRLC